MIKSLKLLSFTKKASLMHMIAIITVQLTEPICSVAQPTDVSTGLKVFYYKGTATYGLPPFTTTKVTDYSGNNYHATLKNTAQGTMDRFLFANDAIYLGSSGYLELPAGTPVMSGGK